MKADLQLTKGAIYNVRITGQTRTTRRVFKTRETRVFGRGKGALRIPCLVFTSTVPKAMRSEFIPKTRTLRFSGLTDYRRYPSTEVSVPFYDLLACREVSQA